MHAGFGPVRIDQSVGSLVSHLTPDLDTHWLTGTSAPCTGVFKPVYLDAGLPDLGPSPKGTYDTASLFWRHERLHRAILIDPSARLPVVQSERDPMEKRMIAAEASMVESSPSERLAFSQICFSETELAEEKWFKKVSQMPINTTSAVYYRKAWQQFNQHAGFPEPF
jgi:hypothetical protein